MKTLLLLAAVMAAIEANGTSTPATEDTGPNDDQSLLSSLLQASGYSHTCVAGALDHCSSAQEDGHFVSLTEGVRRLEQQVSLLVNNLQPRPRHCKDLLDSGYSGKGLRYVWPYSARPHHRVSVYCDNTIDGGGWTVFQRRTNDSVRENFYRTWKTYESGFGDVESEFWLGLSVLHELTTTPQELRVDLHDYEGAHRWAKYGLFQVESADTNYRLTIGRYSGDAGDSMDYHNGQQFSTHDADHDAISSENCAETRRGAWWYNSCDYVNLNGFQHEGKYSTDRDEGIHWRHWLGDYYSLRRTSMMIRPAV